MSLDIKWKNPIDNFGIKEYHLYLNDKLVGKTKTNHYRIENLEPETKYVIYIEAVDFLQIIYQGLIKLKRKLLHINIIVYQVKSKQSIILLWIKI